MIMKLPPLYLIESFLAFTEAKSISQAAMALKISQPALTLHLKIFAQSFTQDVFAVEGRRKVLTPFGLGLKEIFSRRFANLENEVKTLVDQFQDPKNAKVRIAGRGEILNYIAPRIDFEGQIVFHDVDGVSAVDGVIGRKYEIAISNHVHKAQSLHAKKLFSDEFALILPSKWFGERKTLTAELMHDLLKRPYLSYREDDHLMQQVLRHYNIASEAHKYRVISYWPNILTMVELGQGWALAPTRYNPGSQTVSLNIPRKILDETQFYMLYRKESSTLPWFKNLLSELTSAAK